MNSIHQFGSQEPSSLHGIAEDNGLADVFFVGSLGQSGYICRLDNSSQFVWSKSYSIDAEKMVFTSAINAETAAAQNASGVPNHDLIVLGRIETAIANRTQHVAMRVDEAGNVKWLTKVFTKNSRFTIKIARLGNNFCIAGWHEISSSYDKIELHLIDGNGTWKKSSKIDFQNDDQVKDLVEIVPGVLALLGETGNSGFLSIIIDDPTNNSFLCEGVALKVGRSKSRTSIQKIFSSINMGGVSRFFVVGTTVNGSNTRSFIIGMDTNARKPSFIEFQCSSQNDQNYRLISSDQHLFVLGDDGGKPDTSYVLKLDFNLNIIWAKKIVADSRVRLVDIALRGKNEIWVCGSIEDKSRNWQSLVIHTDLELNTCKTVNLNVPVTSPTTISGDLLKPIITNLQSTILDAKIKATERERTVVQICPKPFNLSKGAWIQSPFVFLQSAGSLGSDSSKGIHLRWFFLRSLGDNHLAKGNLATTISFFNKPNDFVEIYRARYDVKIQRTLDFKITAPALISHADYRWVYEVDNQLIYFNFQDHARYDSVHGQIDPAAQPFAFISAYGPNKTFNLELRENLAFSVEFEFGAQTQSILKVETFSVQGDALLEEVGITARRTFQPQSMQPKRVLAENLRFVTFATTADPVIKIKFEMYSDLLNFKIGNNGWNKFGDYSLSLDTNAVSLRLEDPSKYLVNNQWSKFQTNSCVNTSNYMARWSMQADGLKQGVTTYLTLSETDPKAAVRFTESIDPPSPPPPAIPVSRPSMQINLLDMLQVASADFHIARMLGLGAIDGSVTTTADQYIYMMVYSTTAALDDSKPADIRQHIYLSLPTSQSDQRLPQPITTLPLTYGIDVYQGTSQNELLTDENGYLPFEPVRYVNVRTVPTFNYSLSNGFFLPPTEFERSEFTEPVFAGVNYRRANNPIWQRPEITHDSTFLDTGTPAVFETLPLSFRDGLNEPLLRHAERDAGIHTYAAYPINMFSRAGAAENEVSTDTTAFIKPNLLLPPHNLMVQLVQEESPLILTSANEQLMLGAITISDKTLLRITFDYSHLHDINYQFGKKVQIFFRRELPLEVVGAVQSISNFAADSFATITTQAFTFNSTGQTVTPNILASVLPNFKGAAFVLNGQDYTILSAQQTSATGDFPRFVIKKNVIKNTQVQSDGSVISTQSYAPIVASPSDRFMVIENLSTPGSWESYNPIGLEVEIGDASWTETTETFQNPEGQLITQHVRGVWDSTTVQGITVPSNVPGYYEITFHNYKLAHHPQYLDFTVSPNGHSIDWYKGVVRVPLTNGPSTTARKKALEVVSIENIGNTNKLKLLAHDQYYGNGETIAVGTVSAVNFYPGYRVYMRAQIAHFGATEILPALGENSRKSLLSLRTRDTSTQDAQGADYYSPLRSPAVVYALEIIDPVPPQKPIGPLYATPPDYYGKSTYTFTTEFRAETFAAVFYRADTRAILGALYSHETLTTILSRLPDPRDDQFYNSRVADIFAFNLNFLAFPIDGQSYAFPEPDNIDSGFEPVINISPSQRIELVKKAVFSSFIPLTEQPIILSRIRGGAYVPSPKKPTVRDIAGRALDPADPEYDIAPMAKRLDGTNKVRFTDFTLDGDMSADTTYCYFAREMSNRMSLSDPSEIMGPIQLVNKTPPDQPVVKKLFSKATDPVSQLTPAVEFEINAYHDSYDIKFINLYRTDLLANASTPRTMELVRSIPIADVTIVDGIWKVTDDFTSIDFPPFGDLLYYKIVAVKEVAYANAAGDSIIEQVPSQPSKTLLTNIIDTINPAPPVLSHSFASANPKEIIGLVLTWTKTTYKGQYTLLKMSAAGTWTKLFEIVTNNAAELTYNIPAALSKIDEDGNMIFHRFKVSVQSTSGLLNLIENRITI
jgi:hypothetical protein